MVSIATLPRKARGHKQAKNGSAQTKTGQPIDFDVLSRNEIKTIFGLHEFLPSLCGKAGLGRRKKKEGEEEAYTL